MAIPMLKIRRPTGRLIFNMGIPIPGKTVFYIETGPSIFQYPHNKYFIARPVGRGMGCLMWASSLIHVLLLSWASCQIRKIAGAHAPGMPGTFSPSPQVSDPDMHHGTCVTHVPWCMPGSLTIGFLWNRRRGKTFPAFPAHAQPAILRIW